MTHLANKTNNDTAPTYIYWEIIIYKLEFIEELSLLEVHAQWTTKDLSQLGHFPGHFRRKVAPHPLPKIYAHVWPA